MSAVSVYMEKSQREREIERKKKKNGGSNNPVAAYTTNRFSGFWYNSSFFFSLLFHTNIYIYKSAHPLTHNYTPHITHIFLYYTLHSFPFGIFLLLFFSFRSSLYYLFFSILLLLLCVYVCCCYVHLIPRSSERCMVTFL